MVAYSILQAHVTYDTLKIALNIQVNVFTYLHAGTGSCTSRNKVYHFKYSFNKYIEL